MTYSKVPGKRKLPGTYTHKTCISCQVRGNYGMLAPASMPHIASEETANEHQHPHQRERGGRTVRRGHRTVRAPHNHMVGIYRRLAEDYTAQAAQLLNSDNTR